MTNSRSFKYIGDILAIIVDKEAKKKQIALSCKNLFLENVLSEITISQIAKTAGIGKGTIYDYFKNKEEILFEVVNILVQEHNIKKEKLLSQAFSTKDKVKAFFEFYYSSDDEDIRKLYKKFISVSLVCPQEEMIDFQTTCFDSYFKWFETIIKQGIDNGELIPQALSLTKGLFCFGDGIFIASQMTKDLIYVKQDINEYIDTLFKLVETKKGE
jgi:AcrR family transcriptional regulator